MKQVLFINACGREGSRSLHLARRLLEKCSGRVTELRLEDEDLAPLSNSELDEREAYIAHGDYSNPMFRYARQFSDADEVVFAAPYWDLSFPSVLKVYMERICVRGITFTFTPEGEPVGLCKAKKLYYVTTMGAEGLPFEYGFGYIKAVCGMYFGIHEAELISACGLDLEGRDAQKIISDKERELSGRSQW